MVPCPFSPSSSLAYAPCSSLAASPSSCPFSALHDCRPSRMNWMQSGPVSCVRSCPCPCPWSATVTEPFDETAKVTAIASTSAFVVSCLHHLDLACVSGRGRGSCLGNVNASEKTAYGDLLRDP
ncbi:hypothetical protein FA15DRAFT_117151 [Coprinopsis marcescibilis]|uniref:Uncharacterized protein n=1 Tax=Coprinopsis marcescibilis TaxID=230819 RepID=A0A5C3KKA0_COPMA|nr:hypothetical protein FA15DRAFT_117151 [Coprinopsis marcescibilis]